MILLYKLLCIGLGVVLGQLIGFKQADKIWERNNREQGELLDKLIRLLKKKEDGNKH